MRILITFALESEFAPWRNLRTFVREPGAAPVAWRTNIGSAEVRVALTGMRCARWSRQARQHTFEGAPDLCISAGLAGGLRPDLRSGDVVVAGAVTARPERRLLMPQPALVEAAVKSGAQMVETLVTSNRIAATAAEKAQLSLHGDAVEMESYDVLVAAGGRGVPAVAIRAISDTADQDLPYDFNRFLDAAGNVSPVLAIRQLVLRPHRIPALLRLRQQNHRAAEALCAFLDRFVAALAESHPQADPFEEEVAAT